MLNPTGLKTKILQAIEDCVQPALEQAIKEIFECDTSDTQEKAKRFAQAFVDIGGETFAENMAEIIDAYIKSGAIHGTVLTAGGPTTQVGVIAPVNLGNPTAGAVPNTLGII